MIDPIYGFVRTCGPSMSPFNAWVFTKGLETLRLRMEAHSTNALTLAQYLAECVEVEQVFYAGLPQHPGHELAKQQQRAFGGVLSFRLKGDKAAAWRFIDAVKIMSLTANLGDTRTIVTHPASTTHSKLSEEDRLAVGIEPGLVRVSVGFEHPEDIIADLAQALEATQH